MPSETSSQISNATNGTEPPRGHVSIKASKDGILKQVVPEYENLMDNYELLWDIPSNDGYLHLVGIIKKFVDQAISANTNYDPKRFEDGKVPMKVLLKDLLTAYKYGLKPFTIKIPATVPKMFKKILMTAVLVVPAKFKALYCLPPTYGEDSTT